MGLMGCGEDWDWGGEVLGGVALGGGLRAGGDCRVGVVMGWRGRWGVWL